MRPSKMHRWEPTDGHTPAMEFRCANGCGGKLRRMGMARGKGGHWQVKVAGTPWQRVNAPGTRRPRCGGREVSA